MKLALRHQTSSARVASCDSPPVRVRVHVRLHRARLDRELAEGWPTDVSPERAFRACQLTRAAMRRGLARSLRALVAEGERSGAIRWGASIPPCAAAMLYREGLLGLAERLERPGPFNASGVARLGMLLSDGLGPLYNPNSERSVSEVIWWVADGLAPCPPHSWASPVVMKVDPEHVAWTCARCGAISLTDNPTVRPE